MTKLAVILAVLSVTGAARAENDRVAPPNRPAIDGYARPRFSLGARGGLMTAEGSIARAASGVLVVLPYTGSGTTVQTELGVHFAPSVTVFAAYDYGSLSRTSLADVRSVDFHALAGGLRFTTNRRSRVGFVAEYGLGYRYVSIADAYGTSIGRGLEPIRVGLGITLIAGAGVRLHAMASLAASQVTRMDYAAGNYNPQPDGSDWQLYRTFTLGGTFDL